MKKIINIKWMHCISCEMILEKELKKLTWVQLLMISYKKWIMEIDYERESDYEKVIKIIEKNWYKVNQINSTWNNNMITNIIALLIVIILFMFTWLFDSIKYIPDTSTLSYSWALLVWLIASISTCLAVTGWLIIWFSKYIDSTNTTNWHIKVQLWFQLWRIIWFFLLGWLLWLTWKLFSLSFSIWSILTFFVWIILLYIWLNILWILPSISRFWIHMPKSFASKIEKLWKPEYAPIAWVLTFFLPCWFTQAMQLLAVSSWSFIWGGLIMLFFVIGTFPVLFSLWLGSSYFEWKKFPIFNKIIAAVLIFFWLITVSNSYNLLNFSSTSNNTNQVTQNKESTNTETINNDVEEITVWFDWYQMDPKELVLEKWKNYKITVLPSENGKWCMSTQTIPKLSSKVSYILKWQAITYDINNAKQWEYDVVCGTMWMWQWVIIVK